MLDDPRGLELPLRYLGASQRGTPRGLQTHIETLSKISIQSKATLSSEARTHYLTTAFLILKLFESQKTLTPSSLTKLIDAGIDWTPRKLLDRSATVSYDQMNRAGYITVQICTESYIFPFLSEAIKIFRKFILSFIFSLVFVSQ